MGDVHQPNGGDQHDGMKPPILPPHLASEWLGVTLHSIGDAVIATNADGIVTFMNPVAESLTGWTATEADGLPLARIFTIVNEETRQAVNSPVDRALRDGAIVGLASHAILIAKDGTERPISDSAAPIRDENGAVAGAVVVFRDITNQRQAEREKQAALDYAENIIATLRHPFLVLDDSLRVKSANHAFFRTFDVSPEETHGQKVYELGHGQWNIPHLRTLLEEILPRNSSFEDFEVEHSFPTIGRRYMLLHARRIHRADEKVDLILLGIEDITERRRLEEERRELETRFTCLVKNVRDHAIFTLDNGGHITSWNVEAERILGYSEEEAVGKHFRLIFTDEDIEHGIPEEELRLARKDGRAEDERWHKRKSGELFWALGIVTPTYDPAGTLSGFSKILRDITERKRMEESLKDADRRKDEFLAMLSHELRNPLAPILNAVHLIRQDGDESEELQTARSVIERQVRHLKRLVDDLLEVSRITTGKVRLQTGRVALNEVVERAVERIRPIVEQYQQNLSLVTPNELIWAQADAARLEQVFGNLLSNASKYNRVGGHIWVTVARENDKAIVRVRDDGLGIDAELQPYIFDLFTQADKSLDRSEGGLGLGLALVKNLVELHQGTVTVQSEGMGKGSEFVVCLPNASTSEVTHELPRPDSSEIKTDTLRVLVVDDNVDAAKISSMLLRAWGHEVRIAHNGPDALHRAAGFQPHIVLLDIGLPNMDGYEVARHFRQDPHIGTARLVAITGYGQEEDLQRSKEAGFDAHLIKPVETTDLKTQLAEAAGSPVR
ncbi:MAG: PAS domain S-box protein [Planctomycetaceae bacterium]|nr:PAS domain S-box protein [Planctomycetaceae bacterium]